jgi:signal peptidase I
MTITFTDDAKAQLERYVDQVRAALAGHDRVDVPDVERDVLTHIESELANEPQPITVDRLSAVLDQLGAPDQWMLAEDAAGVWAATNAARHRRPWWLRAIVAVFTLILGSWISILFFSFLFQFARVEGAAMAPTLNDQDRVVVNKLVYRIHDPRRGDIVWLYYPLNPEKLLVKRVIAEEGDTVRIVDGRVCLNDIPLKDDYVVPEHRSHDDWGPQVVPDGYFFVMGDHRNNSRDSRHWGMVPKRYIIGKVQLRW